MAKQKQVSDALTDIVTEPQAEPAAEPKQAAERDYTRAVSVGLKLSQLAELDAIAQRERVARNSIMKFFLLWSIREYKAGRLTIEATEERRRRLIMP